MNQKLAKSWWLTVVGLVCAIGLVAVARLAAPTLDRLAWLASYDPSESGAGEVIRQRGRSDCGAAALRMILDHYGIEGSSLDELEAALRTRSNGTSLLALKRVAAERGLSSQGLRLNVEGLSQVPMPVIAHVHRSHFVVVRRAGDQLVVDDPAIGRLRMSATAFSRAWDGIILTFERSRRSAGLRAELSVSAATRTSDGGRKHIVSRRRLSYKPVWELPANHPAVSGGSFPRRDLPETHPQQTTTRMESIA